MELANGTAQTVYDAKLCTDLIGNAPTSKKIYRQHMQR